MWEALFCRVHTFANGVISIPFPAQDITPLFFSFFFSLPWCKAAKQARLRKNVQQRSRSDPLSRVFLALEYFARSCLIRWPRRAPTTSLSPRRGGCMRALSSGSSTLGTAVARTGAGKRGSSSLVATHQSRDFRRECNFFCLCWEGLRAEITWAFVVKDGRFRVAV